MKFEITESDYGLYINMKPETVEEMAMLFRATNNAKAVKPFISLSFNRDSPYCGISIPKVKQSVQKNYISNETRKR
jgi:hypothetical protein